MSTQILVSEWHREKLLDKEHIIRFQIVVHCQLSGIRITDGELDCLTVIGYKGSTPLNKLCDLLVKSGVFKTSLSARGAIDRLQDKQLITKDGKNRKVVELAPSFNILNSGNILLDIKCFCKEVI